MPGVVLCSDNSANKRQGGAALPRCLSSPLLPPPDFHEPSSPSLKSKQSSVSSLGRRRISSRLLLACSSIEKKERKRLMAGVFVCSRTSGKERQGGCSASLPFPLAPSSRPLRASCRSLKSKQSSVSSVRRRGGHECRAAPPCRFLPLFLQYRTAPAIRRFLPLFSIDESLLCLLFGASREGQ